MMKLMINTSKLSLCPTGECKEVKSTKERELKKQENLIDGCVKKSSEMLLYKDNNVELICLCLVN